MVGLTLELGLHAGGVGVGGQKAAGGERMRINRREAAGCALIALLMAGLLAGCLSGCATPPSTVSRGLDLNETLAQGPPVPQAAAAQNNRTGTPARSARLLPTLEKTGLDLLDLILPIPSGQVPFWASHVQSGCFAHLLSQWCTQFHLQ